MKKKLVVKKRSGANAGGDARWKLAALLCTPYIRCRTSAQRLATAGAGEGASNSELPRYPTRGLR